MVLFESNERILLTTLAGRACDPISERQRDRETERQRDRETERQRDKETERQRDRESERLGMWLERFWVS